MENIDYSPRSSSQRLRPKRANFSNNQLERRNELLARHTSERNKYLRSRRMRSLLAVVSADPCSDDVVSEDGDIICASTEKPQSIPPTTLETTSVDLLRHQQGSSSNAPLYSLSSASSTLVPPLAPQQSIFNLAGAPTTHFSIAPRSNQASLSLSSSSSSSSYQQNSDKIDEDHARLSWANQLTIPEMMISVPPDLNGGGGGCGGHFSDVSIDSEGWLAVPRPRGRSCLVTAGRGVTVARDRNGREIARFHSLLPGGSKERSSAGVGTIIECVYTPSISANGGGIFVVIDVLAWKGLSYYDTGFDFRAFWAKCKFDEMNPVSVHASHSRSSSVCMDEEGSGGGGGGGHGLAPLPPSYSFILAPVFECDASGLIAAHGFAYEQGIERDGLLFCCKASRYEPGSTPLVLRWLDESSSSRRRVVKAEDDDDDADTASFGAARDRDGTPNIALSRVSSPNDREDWGSVFPARLRVIEGFKLATSDGFILGSLASSSLSSSGMSTIDDGGMTEHLAVGDLVDAHCTAMVAASSFSSSASSSSSFASAAEASSLMNDDDNNDETPLMTKFTLNPSTPHEAEAKFSLMLPIVKSSRAHRHADSLSHLIWRARARAYLSSSIVPLPTLGDLLSVSMRKL
jgi:hypothetical protein